MRVIYFFAWDLAAVCTIGMFIIASLRKQPTFGDTSTGFPPMVPEKFHTDDASLPRSGSCFWLVVLRGKFDSTNQEHYPDRGSDASSVWNFCAPSSRQMSAVFLERLHYICKTRVDCNKIINLKFSSKIFTKHSTVCILFMVGGGSLKLAHDFMLSKERVILTYLTIISFWSMNRGWWKKQERAVELKTPGGSVQTVGNLCLHVIWQFCLL